MQKSISLKVVWHVLIVFVALAPVAILYPWFGPKAHSILLKDALLRETQFNEAIKVHVDHEVGRIITALQNKSDPMAFALVGTVDKELLSGLLDVIIERENAIRALDLVDSKGQLVIGKDRNRNTIDNSEAEGQKKAQANHEPLINLQDSELVIPLHGRIYVGSPYILQEEESYFHISVPVGLLNQKPLAVLLATIDADKLWRGIEGQLAVTAHRRRLK